MGYNYGYPTGNPTCNFRHMVLQAQSISDSFARDACARVLSKTSGAERSNIGAAGIAVSD